MDFEAYLWKYTSYVNLAGNFDSFEFKLPRLHK